jgi:hypothetical protein
MPAIGRARLSLRRDLSRFFHAAEFTGQCRESSRYRLSGLSFFGISRCGTHSSLVVNPTEFRFDESDGLRVLFYFERPSTRALTLAAAFCRVHIADQNLRFTSRVVAGPLQEPPSSLKHIQLVVLGSLHHGGALSEVLLHISG